MSASILGRASRFQVVLHVDADALRAGSDPDSGDAVLEDGPRVSAEMSRRLACDASRVVMLHDGNGGVLDVGRRTRTVPPALRRALEHRDRGCRFPGCGNRICDAHHVTHWADGGETSLGNLVLVCRAHHRALHEGGFRMEIGSGGECRFYRPDGRSLPAVPDPPRLPADPRSALEDAHRRLGLAIHPETAASGWTGERFDLHWALFTLRRE